MSEIHDDFEIIYEPNFLTSHMHASPYRSSGIHIRTGDTYLTGESEDRFPIDDYLDYNFMKMLEVVPAILSNQRARVPYRSVPVELRFYPEKESVVRTVLCYEDGRSYRDDVPDAGMPVTKEAVVSEIIKTGEGFLENLVKSHPNLEGDDQTQAFCDALERAKQAYCDYIGKQQNDDG